MALHWAARLTIIPPKRVGAASPIATCAVRSINPRPPREKRVFGAREARQARARPPPRLPMHSDCSNNPALAKGSMP